MRIRKDAFVSLFLTLALASLPAKAETKGGQFALNMLEPTPTGDAFVAVSSPRIGGHLEVRAAMLFDYANRPLTIDDGTTAIVANQAFARADLAISFADRFLISIHVPYAILQSGEDPNVVGLQPLPLRAQALGDVRVGARARLVGKSDFAPFQFGLGANVFAPTAPADSFVGEDTVRIDVHALAGGRLRLRVPVLWSASAGAMLRTSANPNPSTFRFGAGFATLLGDERLSLGVQAFGTRSFGETTLIDAEFSDIMAPANVGIEMLGEARVRLFRGLTFAVAAGPGLFSGLGTAAFRGVALIGWAPKATENTVQKSVDLGPPKDRDNDGLRDDVDACPDEPGELSGDPSKDGCPPADRDGDEILDIDDACPLVAGPKQDANEKNGCPLDSDEDGVPDAEDVCPNDKGVSENKKKGCPTDRDDDGIFDILDACPDQKGISATEPWQRGCPEDRDGDGVAYPEDVCPIDRGAADAAEKGCPRYVRFNDDAIVVLKKVEVVPSFPTNKVARESMPVLAEIRDMLRDRPDIVKLEVQGHADDTGDLQKKQDSSQESAEIVMRALVALGVPAEKLVAKGHGHKRPIADNRLPEGRRANQRIAFEVLERAK